MRFAEAAHWHPGLKRLPLFGRQSTQSLGLDVTETNRIDRNIEPRHFFGERLSQADQASFGGGVISLARRCEDSTQRRNINDSTAALRDHRWQYSLAPVK